MFDKTLVVGPSWVGDMMMAQALFKAIKMRYPQTAIDVLAPDWSGPITERMPEVDGRIAMPLKHGEIGFRKRYKLGKSLRSAPYQRCYVLPNSFKSALIPFWAKIPERIGWRGEWRIGLLNKVRILDKKKYPLMVQRYIALAFDENDSFSYTRFTPHLQVEKEKVKQALEKYHLNRDHQAIMVLCPGAEFGPSKRWPISYYAEVANHFLSKGSQICILGSTKDQPLAQAIVDLTNNQCIDLTGRTSLGEAIDLMSCAKQIISNDSGLMHIGAGLKKSLVAIYGSTDPGFTPPLSDRVIIKKENLRCSPCFQRTCPLQHHECMQKLSASYVIEAVEKLSCTGY